MPAYSVVRNPSEYRAQKGTNACWWDGEVWVSGEIDSFVVKTKGEVAVRGCIESAVLVHYFRAIDS